MATSSGAAAAALPGHSPGVTRISPTNQLWLVRGIDQAAHRLFVDDVTNTTFRQSDDWGATFSGNKGFPAGVDSIAKIIRFKGTLYAIGRNPTTGLVGVYRTTPTPGNEPFKWSGPTLKLSPPVAVLGTDFNSDARYLYVGEYGDPKPGPRLHRSRDGIHWQTVWGPARGIRHVHGVAADPYRPGDVWMTVGDGVPAIWQSSRHGARRSWRLVIRSSAWQSVQISFGRRGVYLAADAAGGRRPSTFFVVNRRTLKPRPGTPQRYQSIAPPGSPPGTRYLSNAFFGAVDPSHGAYYCVANDNSEGGHAGDGSWQGFFGVRRIGGPVTVVDPGGAGISMNGEVFFGGGRVWSGQWSVPSLR